MTYLVDVKKVSLQELYGKQFATPADRISKCLVIFRKELESKRELMQQEGKVGPFDIGESFIDEIDFAIKKINDRSLFKPSQHEVQRVIGDSGPAITLEAAVEDE